jgi:hypothetical protein
MQDENDSLAGMRSQEYRAAGGAVEGSGSFLEKRTKKLWRLCTS